MTELRGFEDVTIRRGFSVMGSIFQGGGEGGLRMLQSEGGCLLWGQFFRGGGEG